MRFGVNIPNFGPGTNPETLLRWARFAADAGFHLIMLSDHVAITPDVQDEFPAPFYDPFVTLGWLAAQVSHIEIGTTVIILPYRHPLATARQAANLQRLSGGRLILGVGVGWARQEFAALGVPYERRGAIADEYLAIIRAFFTGDTASSRGQFATFRDVQTEPGEAGPRPPIWVGGASDAALRRAARLGDGWHPYRKSVTWLRDEAMPRLRRLAEASARPTPALCPRLTVQVTDAPWPEGRRVAGQGTLDQIRADLADLAALGAPYVLLDTYAGNPQQTLSPERDWATLTLLAEQVLDLAGETLR